jgi:hypothetical protein
MNRKAAGILVLIATAFAVLVGAEQAKSQAKPKPMAKAPATFSGEIVTVDAQAHTFAVRGPDGHEMKFRAEAGSKVMVNGQPKSVTDLTRGEHVKVSYTGSGDVLTATAVTVEQPKKKG